MRVELREAGHAPALEAIADDAAARTRVRPRADHLGILLGLGVFAYLLAYPRVLNISDESVVLYAAKRILEGQVIYRDFFEFLTPVSFYFFALVYAVAGVSFLPVRIVMAAINAGSGMLLYGLARKVAGRAEAALAVVAFAAGYLPAWNVVSPHWLSTALCLATATVVLSDRLRDAPRARAAIGGALAGLTFCNQQQRGVFLGAWLLVALAIAAAAGGRDGWRQRCGAALAWATVGGFAVALPILGYCMWRASPEKMFAAVYTFVTKNYAGRIAGAVRWGGTWWIGHHLESVSWAWAAKAFPLLLGVETVVLLGGWLVTRRMSVARATLLVLAVAMCASILYFPDLVHIAFIAPFPLIVAAALLHELRTARVPRVGTLMRTVGGIALAVGFVGALHRGASNLFFYRQLHPVRYATAFGTLAGATETQQVYEGLRDAMQIVPTERRTLFSYPSDASLYLTVPARNPTPFSLLLRSYDAEQYQQVVDAIERRQIDFVAILAAFVRPDDPVVKAAQDNYVERAKIGSWGLYRVYARPDLQ